MKEITNDNNVSLLKLPIKSLLKKRSCLGTNYFRAAKMSSNYRWWRPIAELLIFFLVAGLLLVLWTVLGMLINPQMVISDYMSDFLGIDNSFDHISPRKPLNFIISMMTIILLIPAVMVAVRTVGKRSFKTVLSVTGRFRTRLFLRAVAVIALFFIILDAIAIIFVFDSYPASELKVDILSLGALLLVLIFIPLQAASEEIFFRGFLSQFFGAWTPYVAVPILFSLPFFTFSHNYNSLGLIEISIFAVCLGILAWITGGLEIPIAFHMVNNIVVFLPYCFGIVPPNPKDISISHFVIGSAMIIIITLVIVFYPKIVGVLNWRNVTRSVN
ncbi:CPBP family intramembrane metalloprotease [Xenorhabdus sp. XENO-10]|uniref:CPBP family intramembrane metalloprotease n=1 Tax=Xenorhabdus yunnanensis TaxID=3025878 RepID=A0ABT5LEF1_9GAMM|nr:CPBP family intramembrane glutamic endopeptidase [Xenorhabdus yunnanensis]MDC9588284.1 CPBP family intramembrane metalloprotease [Xenorhabdus yunnanensis]